jgi:hypothetical protein
VIYYPAGPTLITFFQDATPVTWLRIERTISGSAKVTDAAAPHSVDRLVPPSSFPQ